MNKTTNRYSPEVRERAVRMVLEHQHEHESQWAAIESVASKIGCAAKMESQELHNIAPNTSPQLGTDGIPSLRPRAASRSRRLAARLSEAASSACIVRSTD